MKWYRTCSGARKSPWTFYHGTDSEPFGEFDQSSAAKPERHYNPFGEAMYVTDKQDFAKLFGKNVYPVNLPANAKVKTMSPAQARSSIEDILKRAMGKVGIPYRDTDIRFKIELNRQMEKASYSPYDAIMEGIAFVQATYPDIAEAYPDAVSDLATRKFSKYDAVVLRGTNDPNYIYFGGKPTKEVMIFNPAYQRTQQA